MIRMIVTSFISPNAKAKTAAISKIHTNASLNWCKTSFAHRHLSRFSILFEPYSLNRFPASSSESPPKFVPNFPKTSSALKLYICFSIALRRCRTPTIYSSKYFSLSFFSFIYKEFSFINSRYSFLFLNSLRITPVSQIPPFLFPV